MSDAAADVDRRLAAILEDLTDELRVRGAVDLARIEAEHPDLSDEVRQLWGAVMVTEAVAAGASSIDPDATAGDGPAAPLAEPTGDEIEGYDIVEEIGRGGMGVVYRAAQPSLGREVALKVLQRFGSAAGDLGRFRAEAMAAARLAHPGIVPVYEVGESRARPYFSMMLVEGQTLAKRLAGGPLSNREAAGLLLKIADAVRHAHEQGVLHRDLKPSNILLDADGAPRITDFGLAKRLDAGDGLTLSGAMLGTPAYMAPEQAAGDRDRTGVWTDVYGLGVLLYQMLTGRPPFQAPTAVDTVLLVLEQDPPPPRLLNPRVDRELEMICLKCIQKPIDLRYASAAEVVADLEAYLAGEPVAAATGGLGQIVARWFRETHHAPVLENWGLLWMWHSLALLVLCFCTWRLEQAGSQEYWHYVLLWGGGLAVWAPTFWRLRSRAGPVSFVERQIAHIWGASICATMLLFSVEAMLGMPPLQLTPVLGVISGSVFAAKAGILSGEFYVPAAALYASAPVIAWIQASGSNLGVLVFGVVCAASFFFPGLKYYRQRRQRAKA